MSDKPVTVILIGPFPGPVHGVSVINAKLADRMAAQNLCVERIDLSPGSRRGIAYHATRTFRTLGGFFRLLGLRGKRRAIMSVDGGGGLLYNIVLALALRLTGQDMALYHHSTGYVVADSALMRALLAVAGPRVPHIFCSEKMAALFCARYRNSGAVLIVNNAAWIDPPAPGPGSQGGLRFGFLSALTLEKGLGRAIDTLRQAHQQGLDAELVLAGAVVNPAGERLLREAQVEFGSALTWRGVLSGTDKADFYRTLDVFLFASLYSHETQSLVVPEALAAATPVIAYDHRFVGDILGQGGLLIPGTEAFAGKAVAWIAAGRNDWPSRRGAARRQFEHEWTQAAGQLDRLIAWASGR